MCGEHVQKFFAAPLDAIGHLASRNMSCGTSFSYYWMYSCAWLNSLICFFSVVVLLFKQSMLKVDHLFLICVSHSKVLSAISFLKCWMLFITFLKSPAKSLFCRMMLLKLSLMSVNVGTNWDDPFRLTSGANQQLLWLIQTMMLRGAGSTITTMKQ
jgi:hypothetical protein